MLNNGLKFIDKPYGAGMLEVNDIEELEINIDSLDCVTFVEITIAKSLCQIHGNMSETEFAYYLQKIRYRDGIINGYTSRLHYMTEWINDNIKKNIIKDITEENSNHSITIPINYMSTHYSQYWQLRESYDDLAKMIDIEKKLSLQKIHFLPKELLPDEGFKWIKNGDIIAITTNSPGMDISHIGIAIYIKNNLHLLHASSRAKKVTIEKQSLNKQLSRNKNYTGIRVLRFKQ